MIALTVTTPEAVAVAVAGVAQVRAEDPAGGFGIRPGHADFLTALVPTVLMWRFADGREGFCAVRGGLLTVSGGTTVTVATREAVPGDDLEVLEHEVLTRFARTRAEEEEARSGTRRLQVSALRHMLAYLRPDAAGHPKAPPPARGGEP
ncbi:F0F1 ATP synthase subunit epsilon [Azospirillum sp. ST 5-10]|uniref:F0F1 ATP synthase subunit epsilon n=1 Tax=unclassified Azospirillum TaxID=2630922 RepID=UPI003F49D643